MKNTLSKANAAFRDQDYSKAIELYEDVLSKYPMLSNTIGFNIALAKDKLKGLGQELPDPADSIKAEIPTINFDTIKDEFTPYRKSVAPEPAVKLIAFYLPQFHPFAENDKWWGKGFTEWTNVGKAKPNYENHTQPHCPIHFGYYDLRIAEVQEEQAKLAKEYGIHGFSYYFYWFDGKTLMESPLKAMLANKRVDMPFCLTWANENWSRRWDGLENDVLIAQNHSQEDSLAFIRHLIPYFKDSRYIRIDNCPVLIVYRPNIIPDIKETANIWREEMIKNGIPGIYLISAQTFGIKSPEPFGFDASVEFPPHTVVSTDVQHQVKNLSPSFTGHVFSYDQVVTNAVQSPEPEYKLFRAAMLSWDNTARKQDASHIFHGFSLLQYKQWLTSICAQNVFNEKYASDEKLVFVNAWNEWAEGTHLEPDRKYGYGYLETTRSVVGQFDRELVRIVNSQKIQKRNDIAVILHIHYGELWADIKKRLKTLSKFGFDLYVTATNKEIVRTVKNDFKQAHVSLVENRGRDVLPFIETLRKIHTLNYLAVCKLHSKKSLYRNDGDTLRDEIYDSLLGSSSLVKEIISIFKNQPSQGILVPGKFLLRHNDHNMTFNKASVESLSKKMKVDFKYSHFPAGSMFWFRQSALSRILHLSPSDFDLERGLADGTTAHGVERLFCIISEGIGYETGTIPPTAAAIAGCNKASLNV